VEPGGDTGRRRPGLFDEYKDVTIEVDPKDNELITVK
jgi:hypothetical protein